MGRYILNILIALDQLVDTLIGGYPDETLSASAWLGEQQGKVIPCIMRPVIDFLFCLSSGIIAARRTMQRNSASSILHSLTSKLESN